MKRFSFLRRTGFAAVAVLGMLVGLAVSAQAQYPYNDPRYYPPPRYNEGYYGGGYQQSAQQPIINGYQLGYGLGSNDRAYGHSYNVTRHKVYRDADSGRSNWRGDKDDYKQFFRQGFEQGYRDGYSGYPRRTYRGYNDYQYNAPYGYPNQHPRNTYPRRRYPRHRDYYPY